MARIQRFQAQSGLRPAAGPRGQIKSYTGQALEQLGGQITNMAAKFEEQNERRRNMEDTDNFQQLEARVRTGLFEAEQGMQPGANGFTDGFLTGTFDPLAEEYLNGIDDPELRESRRRDLATLRERYTLQAARTEAGEVDRYQSGLITTNADGAFTRISENPDAFDQEMELLEELINGSGLSAVRRDELLSAVRQGGAEVFLETLAETDPLRLLRETGGDIGALDVETGAAILTNILRENSTVRGRPGERVGEYGMLRSDLARIAAADGVDITAAGGLDAIVSNPTTARFYAQKHLEDLMTRFDDPRDAVAAFYMGEEYVRGGYEPSSLPRAVRSTINSIFEVMPVGNPGATFSPGSGAQHPRAFGTFTTYSEMDRAAYAILSIESSGGEYSTMGPVVDGDRAYGAFQVMGFNVGPWTERWVGRRMTPEEFLADPAAQDAVFRGQFGMYMRNRGGDIGLAARDWFGWGESDGYLSGEEYMERARAVFNEGAAAGRNGPAIPLTDGNGTPYAATSLDDIDPVIISTAQNVLAQFGLTEVPVLDAERPENAGYGAANSQHIVFHADGTPTGRRGALDISLAGMSEQQVVELVQAFSAAGITGIGLYRGGGFNHIHIDMGARRSWQEGGPASWGAVLAQHNSNAFNGLALPYGGGVSTSSRVAGARGSVVRGAQDAAIEALTGANRSTEAIREESQIFLDDMITAYENGGELGNSDLIEESLAVLSPDQQRSYREDIAAMQEVRALTQNLADMTRSDMEGLRNQLQNPDAGFGNTAYGARVREDVEAAIQEEEALRTRNPAAAAMRDPEVQNAWMNVVVDPETGLASGEAVQEYIRLNRDIQIRRFGIHPDNTRSLPDQHLAIIANEVTEAIYNPGLTSDERRARIALQASIAVQRFGDEAAAVMRDVMNFMDRGPTESRSIDVAALMTGAVNRAVRDSGSDVTVADPAANVVADPDDPPEPDMSDLNPDDPEAARQAAARIQRLRGEESRSRAIERLPVEMQEEVRRLLGG
jgi:hypothetical protein